MKGISDLKIVGIDETRPPYIRKEPYIDIFFKLSHQAPVDWCKELNSLMSKQKITTNATIIEKEGKFIGAWVRSADEIASLLTTLKSTISECTRKYIEQIQLAAQQSNAANASLGQDTGPQADLNRIVASLNFDDDSE